MNSSKVSFVLGPCVHKTKIAVILRKYFIPSLDEIEHCLHKNKKMLCHYIHPTCSFERVKNGYNYFPRTICKETCVRSTADCDRTFEFLRTSYEIHKYCPRFNLTSTAHKLPGCHEFPEKNMQFIAKCLNIEEAGK